MKRILNLPEETSRRRVFRSLPGCDETVPLAIPRSAAVVALGLCSA